MRAIRVVAQGILSLLLGAVLVGLGLVFCVLMLGLTVLSGCLDLPAVLFLGCLISAVAGSVLLINGKRKLRAWLG
ncbi:MAG: hypothetical protein QXR87_02095 [Candidatus Hadarchaeales archaeon]